MLTLYGFLATTLLVLEGSSCLLRQADKTPDSSGSTGTISDESSPTPASVLAAFLHNNPSLSDKVAVLTVPTELLERLKHCFAYTVDTSTYAEITGLTREEADAFCTTASAEYRVWLREDLSKTFPGNSIHRSRKVEGTIEALSTGAKGLKDKLSYNGTLTPDNWNRPQGWHSDTNKRQILTLLTVEMGDELDKARSGTWIRARRAGMDASRAPDVDSEDETFERIFYFDVEPPHYFDRSPSFGLSPPLHTEWVRGIGAPSTTTAPTTSRFCSGLGDSLYHNFEKVEKSSANTKEKERVLNSTLPKQCFVGRQRSLTQNQSGGSGTGGASGGANGATQFPAIPGTVLAFFDDAVYHAGPQLIFREDVKKEWGVFDLLGLKRHIIREFVEVGEDSAEPEYNREQPEEEFVLTVRELSILQDDP